MLNQKRAASLLVFLAVLPFVVLCFYSHPSADDFSDAVNRLSKGFWLSQKELYLQLTGRLFTSVILTEANPLVLGLLKFYWIMPLLALGLLFLGLYALLTAVSDTTWSARTRILGVGIVLALWLTQTPGLAEAVYWFNGMAVYTVPAALLLFWLAALIRFWQASSGNCYIKWLTVTVLLGTCVLWSNEIIALPLMAVVGGLFVWEWQRRGARRWLFVGLVGWFSVALAVSLLAPGNISRAVAIGAVVPWSQIVLGTAGSSAYVLINWASSGVLLACTALLLPALAQLVAAQPEAIRRFAVLQPKQLLVASGYLLLLLPLSSLPSYWATGGLMPPRARSSVFLVFLLGWFALIVGILVLSRTSRWMKKLSTHRSWPPPVAGLLWVWLLLNLVTDHNTRVAHRDLGRASNNAVLAYRDWLSGNAARYDAILNARYQFLRSSTAQRVQVPALPREARPASLYYYDITTDSTFLMDEDYARFFHKKKVWTGPGGLSRPSRTYQPSSTGD